MNQGMISKRYARALLLYAKGQKAEDTLFSEMKTLASIYAQEPRLRVAMENPMLNVKDKFELTKAAIGGKTSEQYAKFAQLVVDHKREAHLHTIALCYIDLYCELKNINTAKLITATEVDERTIDKMKALTQKIKPGNLDFETAVDPNIAGGFILYVDTYRLDASVRTQLSKIKQDLIKENSKAS